jgi:hypothetical protein
MPCSPRSAPPRARGWAVSAEQVELADGFARAPDGRSLAFAELAADGLRVTTAFGNDNRLTYTYGSAAAHVAVDPGTGDVKLLDCLVVEDVGRIVNPLTLHGQAIGGMVQGLGGAFLEHLVYDASGQLLAGNLIAPTPAWQRLVAATYPSALAVYRREAFQAEQFDIDQLRRFCQALPSGFELRQVRLEEVTQFATDLNPALIYNFRSHEEFITRGVGVGILH